MITTSNLNNRNLVFPLFGVQLFSHSNIGDEINVLRYKNRFLKWEDGCFSARIDFSFSNKFLSFQKPFPNLFQRFPIAAIPKTYRYTYDTCQVLSFFLYINRPRLSVSLNVHLLCLKKKTDVHLFPPFNFIYWGPLLCKNRSNTLSESIRKYRWQFLNRLSFVRYQLLLDGLSKKRVQYLYELNISESQEKWLT